MPFMPWTPELELGLPEIDDQHRQLVALTNALHDELSGASPRRSAVGEILEGLVDYTHNHFIVEEVLFQQHHYAEAPAPQAEPDGFTRKALDLLMRFDEGQEVTLEALEFLKQWLVHHICKVDRAYLPFMREALQAQHAAALA